MEIWLKKTDSNSIKFPVLPSTFEMSCTQNNEVVTINSLGDINLLGKRGLKSIDLSSFFPTQDYDFLVASREDNPYTYVDKIEKWKDNNTVLQLIITETSINMYCTVEEFTYGHDTSDDVNYSITLKEYVYIAGRSTKSTGATTYTTKKGDTLKKIAKKTTGKASNWKTIWKANKGKIGNDYTAKLKAGIKLTIKV